MGNEIEQIAQQNEMSIEFVTWFFNEKKVGCGNVWFMMMAAMWEGWKGRSIEMDKLAAENVALALENVAMKQIVDSVTNLDNEPQYHAEGMGCGLEDRGNSPVNDVTAGKPFTILLPDISSKAFWSGAGKNENFHPETYRHWVKEAIERYCAIARINVEVK